MNRRPVLAFVAGAVLFLAIALATSMLHPPLAVYAVESVLAGIAGGFLAGL